MSSLHSCKKVSEELWRYIDREMSASAMAEISRELRRCEVCQRRYEALARESKVLRMAFVETPFGEGFVSKFRQRFDEQPDLEDLYPLYDEEAFEELHEPLSSAAQRRRRFLTVAALLVLIPGIVALGLFINHRQGTQLGAVRVLASGGAGAEGGVRVLNGKRQPEGTLSHGQQAGFGPGTVFLLDEGIELNLFLGSEEEKSADAVLRLTGPAEFQIDGDATVGRFGAHLEEGSVLAHVCPLSEDERFEIRTPHAATRVVGTSFRVEVLEESTLLRVSSGTVTFGAVDEDGDLLGGPVLAVTPENGSVDSALLTLAEEDGHAAAPVEVSGDSRDGGGVDAHGGARGAVGPATETSRGSGEASLGGTEGLGGSGAGAAKSALDQAVNGKSKGSAEKKRRGTSRSGSSRRNHFPSDKGSSDIQ